MLRLYLVTLVFGISVVQGQQKSKYLLQAEGLADINTAQAIETAKQAFVQATKQKDYYNACRSAIFLGNAYRKLDDYKAAIHYDSLAMLQARQRQSDTLLQQKAVNSYARNFVETLQLDKAETVLTRNTALFTSYYTTQTCLWYEMKALCYFNRIRFGDAVTLGKKAQDVAQLLHDTTAMMHAQMMVFKFQSMMLQSQSMDLAFESLAYFEETDNFVYAAQAANIIGYAFETTHNLNKALVYYQKALTNNLATGNRKEAVQTRMNMADAYRAGQQFNLAKPILYEGYQFYSKTHFLKGMVAATLRLAKIYSDTEQYDSAIIFFKLTDTLNKQLNLPIARIGSRGWQAQMQAKLKNFALSDSLANLAVNEMLHEHYQDVSGPTLTMLKEAGTITRADLQKGNRFQSQEAAIAPPLQQIEISDYERVEHLNWQTGASSAKDSTYREKNSRQQLEAESKYRVGKYKDTLFIEKQTTGKVKRQAYSLSWVLAAVVTILLIVAAGLYWQRKKRKQAEQDKTWLAQLREEVHHRVKNNLGVVKAVVETLGATMPQQMPIDDLTARIDSIALLHEHLYKDNEAAEKVWLQHYLEALTQSIVSIYKPVKMVQITIDAVVEVDAETAMNLGLIINELVTNSLKYAFTGRESGIIYITASKESKQLHLTVADDGIGLSLDQKVGYGFKVIKGLSHQLNGKYSYQTHNGTIFKMTLPVTLKKKSYAKAESADSRR